MARYRFYFGAFCAVLVAVIPVVFNTVAVAKDAPKAAGPTVKEKLSLKLKAYIWCIGFSPDGKHVALSVEPYSTEMQPTAVSVWDIETGNEKHRCVTGAKVGAIAWQPKGSRLVFALRDAKNNEKNVVCWDFKTGREVFFNSAEAAIPSLAYRPDGKEFAVAGFRKKNSIEFRDGEKGNFLRAFNQPYVFDIAYSPDGKKLASACQDRTVKITDTNSGEILLVLKGHEGAGRNHQIFANLLRQ